jgi:RHS repeat-associated protein
VNGKGFCCDDAGSQNGGTTTSGGGGNITNGNDNPEIYQYYYHSDHLGSSSFITNLDGEVAQHIEYVPFGEVFVEERNNTWSTPYKFNGKQLDEETGFYYYGARYMDSRTSLWISVDEMAEKYANVSGYAYCLNNPIILNDPDGNDPVPGGGGGIKIYGNAEATKSTLTHKGGTSDLGGNAIDYKDAHIVPAANSKGTVVGYNVFDSKNTSRNMPVLQMDAGDLDEFKKNYDGWMTGARIYYANGEPSEGMKKTAAGLASGNVDWGLAWEGIKQQNKEAWSDPVFVISTLTMWAHAGVELKSVTSLEDVFRNPRALEGMSEAQIREIASKTPGWEVGTLGKGENVGKGLTVRELNSSGTDYTHRYIQYHPGSRRPNHFNGKPYWKVSGNNSGVVKFPRSK